MTTTAAPNHRSRPNPRSLTTMTIAARSRPSLRNLMTMTAAAAPNRPSHRSPTTTTAAAARSRPSLRSRMTMTAAAAARAAPNPRSHRNRMTTTTRPQSTRPASTSRMTTMTAVAPAKTPPAPVPTMARKARVDPRRIPMISTHVRTLSRTITWSWRRCRREKGDGYSGEQRAPVPRLRYMSRPVGRVHSAGVWGLCVRSRRVRALPRRLCALFADTAYRRL